MSGRQDACFSLTRAQCKRYANCYWWSTFLFLEFRLGEGCGAETREILLSHVERNLLRQETIKINYSLK